MAGGREVQEGGDAYTWAWFMLGIAEANTILQSNSPSIEKREQRKKTYKEAKRKNIAYREETEQVAESDAEMTQTLELSDKHFDTGYG